MSYFLDGRCGFLTAPIDWNQVNLVLETNMRQLAIQSIKTILNNTTIVWTISVCFMLFSQVLSIFLRVLCEVVTHKKTIIGSAKAAPAGRNVYRNAGEQPS